MKKYLGLLILGLMLFFEGRAHTIEVVYPKVNNAKISAPSTFFVGSVKPNEKLTINGLEVKVGQNGAFAQSVPLCYGKNEFKLVSDSETVNYSIERIKPPCANSTKKVLQEYSPINFHVKRDGAPLRATPIDGGINRLAHLPENTEVIVNGEMVNFYRVYLCQDVKGWIAKSDVEQDKCSKGNDFYIRKTRRFDDRDFVKYEFDVGGRVPFLISENDDGLHLNLFNLKGFDGIYSLNIPLVKTVGYGVYYGGENKDKFTLKVRKSPHVSKDKPLDGVQIVLDPGHGGKELGAIGCCGDKEKDINLSIALLLKTELEKRGAKILLTRDSDKDVSLADRGKFAKDNEAMILVSIHGNAIPDGQDPIKNKGTSVYYYYKQAKPLAESIINSMINELGVQNDKVRQGSLALTRPTECVSVLVEVGYLINPDDYTKLVDKSFQAKCATAIADGIQNYMLK